MIRVVRLAGESLDLETGTELPKSLVLSNGLREVSIIISDDIAREVVRMQVELKKYVSEHIDNPGVDPDGQPQENVPKSTSPTNIEEAKQQIQRRIQQVTRAQPADPPPLAEVEDSPGDDEGDDGPGSEYEDQNTGTASL
jgi:hypothetical protein